MLGNKISDKINEIEQFAKLNVDTFSSSEVKRYTQFIESMYSDCTTAEIIRLKEIIKIINKKRP